MSKLTPLFKLTFKLTVALGMHSFASSAQASQFSFDAERCYQALEPLQVKLPSQQAADPSNHGAELVVELDGADMSQLIERRPGMIVVQPVQRLAAGTHTLMVAAGTQRASWTFERCAPSGDWGIELQGQMDAHYVVADSEPLSADPVHATQGGLNWGVGHRRQDFSAVLRGDLLHDSRTAYVPDQKRWDVGQYLLQLNYNKRTSLKLGQHSPELDNLAMTYFYRPGVSVDTRFDALNTQIQAFAFDTQETTGLSSPLASAASTQLYGIAVGMNPLPQHRDALRLNILHTHGRHTDDPDNPEFANQQDGHTSSFNLVSETLDQQLEVNAEYANSQYQRSIFGTQLPETSGDAASLTVQFAPQLNGAASALLRARSTRIGEDFFAIGNAFLTPDRASHELQATYGYKAWSLNAQANRERDNLHNSQPATTRNQAQSLAVGYTASKPTSAGLNWLGTATYSLRGEQRKSQRGAVPAFFDEGTNTRYTSVAVEGNHALQNLNWYWRLQRLRVDSKAGFEPSSRTRSINAGVSYTAGQVLSLNTNFSMNRTRLDLGGINRFRTLGLQLRPTKPNWPYLTLELSDNVDTSFGNLLDQQRFAAGFNWRYELLSATTRRPGVALDLSGSFVQARRQNFGLPELRDDGLQILLKITLLGNSINEGALLP